MLEVERMGVDAGYDAYRIKIGEGISLEVTLWPPI